MSKVIVDIEGVEYSSLKDMCEEHSISYMCYHQRLKRNYDKKKALLSGDLRQKRVSHKGLEFDSVSAMLEYFEISHRVYYGRLSRGITGDALFEKRLRIDKKLRIILKDFIDDNENLYDPFGNKFYSVGDLCEYYDITYKSFKNSILLGLSYEEALLIK